MCQNIVGLYGTSAAQYYMGGVNLYGMLTIFDTVLVGYIFCETLLFGVVRANAV